MNQKDTLTIKQLLYAIYSLENEQEADQFLRDLLTEQELLEFANRWKTAQMLDKKISYSTIKKETKLSSTTIARVSKWLTKGTGGYQLMIKKLSSQNHHLQTIRKKGLN